MSGTGISTETEGCLECHPMVTPAIVADWQESLHASIKPGEAQTRPALQKRVSSDSIPPSLTDCVVGCAECHTANATTHADSFEHNGYRIHTVVSPVDCALCHSEETLQYAHNIMSRAYGNLMDNSLYRDLVDQVTGIQNFDGRLLSVETPETQTLEDACLRCHGTRVQVNGMETRETTFGEMEFPILKGWPNQGVGRINPDGTLGSCASCHARHRFSIEMARKPYTCGECHKGPDVPAYKVYSVSKHGNIFSSLHDWWNFSKVPWTPGKDFSAPTCAGCHVSLLTDENGEILARRTHAMNDRLSQRLFGLVYAHPHPSSPDTTIIKNKTGLPLPTELTGAAVDGFLIDPQEQLKRRSNMKQVCSSCHSKSWIDGHFERLDHTVSTTNAQTLSATKILLEAWKQKAALGPDDRDSIFNETIEKKWVEQWLFYANSTRFASAMAGADYGVFANGRWTQASGLQEMKDWLRLLTERNTQKGGLK